MITAEELTTRDYELIIDKSGSMDTKDENGLTRWQAAKESTFAIASKLDELDPDGISIYVFNRQFTRYDNVTPSKVNDIFKENSPYGGTDLALVLNDALQQYFTRKNRGIAKPTTIVVVTDGQPDHPKEVAKVIIAAANKLKTEDELGISFIQIGKDAEARTFLKSLDNDLETQGAKFDIVNTKTFDEVEKDGIIATLLAAVNE